MNVSPISTIHPNGVKFTYITAGLTVHVNAKPNSDGKTYDGRNAYYARVQNGTKPGVLIEYPDGVKRFISNSWYDDVILWSPRKTL